MRMSPRGALFPTAPDSAIDPDELGFRVREGIPAPGPLMEPPMEMEPPDALLVSIVKRVVVFSVAAVAPTTVKELAAMLVTEEPVERKPVPAPMVKAPRVVDEPTSPERVTVPEVPAVSVSGCAPPLRPSTGPPKLIEPLVIPLALIVRGLPFSKTVGVVPSTAKRFAAMTVTGEPM